MSEELTTIFESAIEKKMFPGASCWIARGEKILAHQAFGTTAYDQEYSRPVARDTIYDIASITKLFTTTAFFIAALESGVDVDQPVSRFVPEFATSDKSAITLRQLMQHNSGLQIVLQSQTEVCPEQWLALTAQSQLCAAPGRRVKYVCANFFLLARVVEKISGTLLDDFVTSEILRPLQMMRTTFYPLREFAREEIAPTEILDQAPVYGLVYNEAARAWLNHFQRSNCGNAGLFSTAEDVMKFARFWLDGGAVNGQQLIARETAAAALRGTVPSLRKRKRSVREYVGALRRRSWPKPEVIALCAMGWQTKATFYMSAQAPPDAAGYVGLTGPTMWISPSRRQICIVLNNHLFPDGQAPNRFSVHRQISRWLMAASD